MSIGLPLLAAAVTAVSGEPLEARAAEDDTYLVRSWTTDEGLPQNSVVDIVQTADGYLWLATFGGLARFDGVRFAIFDISNTQELGTNRVLSLFEDSTGALWVGTDHGGVTRHASGRFQHFDVEAGAPAGAVWDIAEGPDGGIWFGGEGLTRYAHGEFVDCVPEDESWSTNQLAIAGPDEVWLATSVGVVHYLRGSTRHYTTDDGLPDDFVTWIGRDTDGEILAGTSEGPAVLSRGRFVPLGAAGEDPAPRLRGALTLADGRRLLGSDGGLLWQRSRGERMRFEHADLPLLRENSVRCLIRDREGSIWVGTNGEGLVRVRVSPFDFLDVSDGIEAAPSLVLTDPAGSDVWVGWSTGGLKRVVDRRVESVPDPLHTAYLEAKRSVHRGEAGRTWMLDSQTATLFVDGIIESEVEHGREVFDPVLEDAAGNLWFGVRSGVGRLRGAEFTEFPLPDGRTGPVRLESGEKGRMWLSTPDGIARFDDGTIEFLPIENFPKGSVRSILDDGGVLWITTYGSGLGRYADGQLRMFTEADGLPDNSLGRLLTDGGDHFWINSNQGVFCVSRADLEARASGSLRPLGCKLLETGEGNGGSACTTADGRMWFPTLYGLAVIDPDRVEKNQVPPQVAIERIDASGEALDLHGDLVISPGKTDVVIEYAGLSFIEPEAVRFRYRLVGYDENWINVGPRRRAYYTNIPPGAYRFEVIACNDDRVWNEVGASIDFELQPFFYQTRWFLGACLLAIGGGLLLFYKGRTRAIRRRNVALSTEIEERQRAEVALRESEERYRVVAEAATDAILTIDELGCIVYANSATERIFGHAPEDCTGQSLDLLLPDPSFTGFVRGGDRSPSWEGKELLGRHADGHEFPIEASLGVLHPHNGSPRFTGIIRDITERRRTEEERLRLEERLRESKKMEAMGRLAGGISHDFNNILTALISHADLLDERLREDASGEALEHVSEIQKCTGLAFSLTNQLLAFSRRQVVQPTLLAPDEVLRRLEPMLRRLIREDIDLDIRVPEGVGAIRADVGQLEQIFMNLVLNGSDAMPNGGTLRVEVAGLELDEIYAACNPDAGVGPHVLISVSDTGSGIPEEVMPHLFEPFFTTKAAGHGTGLGLASVHGIVQQSGGHITVTTEPGRGTTFRVYLPRDEQSGVETYEASRLDSREQQALGGTETVLVCDDYAAVRRATQMILSNNGYRVLSADGPEEALKIAREYAAPIALLITDVVMPGMNGPQLAKEISALQPNIRVLYVSGYTSDVVIHEGVAERGTSFLQKPFVFRELLKRIRELLDSAVEA